MRFMCLLFIFAGTNQIKGLLKLVTNQNKLRVKDVCNSLHPAAQVIVLLFDPEMAIGSAKQE